MLDCSKNKVLSLDSDTRFHRVYPSGASAAKNCHDSEANVEQCKGVSNQYSLFKRLAGVIRPS